jgi:acetyltransferase-like isoleucine patch superfamily enzyme
MLSRFLRLISQNCTRVWLREFKRKNPQVQIGENLRLIGRPVFDVAPDARVKIGSRVTMISLPEGNLAGLSKRCSIGVERGAKLTIGEGCGFSGVSIYCALEISIGSHLTCGANVSIWDTDFHPLDAQARRANDRTAIRRKPVVIGDDVFLGANVLVLKGARIGDRAIIGAGSVVTGNIPSDEIWAGNPARFLRRCDSKTAAAPRLD